MDGSQAGDRRALVPTDNTTLGIGLAIVAVMLMGSQDAVSKVLVQDYSIFQITMMRYWALAGFSIWLVQRQAPLRHAFATSMPVLQVARGLLLMLDIWFFATANRTVPLDELQSISLVNPLLVTVFSIPVLGEKVGPFRWASVVAGFAGTLIILRPGVAPLSAGPLFVLAAATVYALYVTLTRKVSRRDSTATSMLYVGVVGLVVASAAGVWFFEPMTPAAMGLMAVLMVMTCASHGLMMAALRRAPASLLQPFSYLALPWAITLSFVVFGHLIDPLALLGALIIVGAGLVVMARERRQRPPA